MTAEELRDLTAEKMIEKISLNQGLGKFAFERSTFLGWLKVHIIETCWLKDIMFETLDEIASRDC